MKQLINSILKASSLFLVMAFIILSGCQQQKPDPSVELKPLVDKYVEVWNGGNLSDLDAVMSSDYVYHSNKSPDIKGIVDLKKLISSFRTAYPDMKLVIEDEVYSENKSAGRWVFTGTNTGPGEMPPTGKPVSIWGVSIIQYANGKLSEEWIAFDNQSLMEQLGFTMMPPAAEKK